jgi:hypothetical protein
VLAMVGLEAVADCVIGNYCEVYYVVISCILCVDVYGMVWVCVLFGRGDEI